jgi:hypothetical protein
MPMLKNRRIFFHLNAGITPVCMKKESELVCIPYLPEPVPHRAFNCLFIISWPKMLIKSESLVNKCAWSESELPFWGFPVGAPSWLLFWMKMGFLD